MTTIYEDLRDLFFNPRYSDLKIVCQDGTEFRVHCMVISLHSPILASMITESKDSHGQTILRIELPDVDFTTLYMMLQFFYGGDYNDYENVGSFHFPSYVIFMTPEQIDASLETLPCFRVGSTTENGSVDDDYDNTGEPDGSQNKNGDEGTGEAEESCLDVRNHNKGSQTQEPGGDENTDRDDRRDRTFQGHNLFDSLNVYCVASRFNISPLKLLARDRFYRTAEKVLMFSPNIIDEKEARWLTHDDQRIYRSKLAKAVFDDFPQAVRELYETVPESDTMMRAIPPMIIAAGYNSDEFRDSVKPLLEQYPDLVLAVVECMRMPHSGLWSEPSLADSEDGSIR
ncbi:hypothetical protein NUW58_g9098 [Xylaria curta]|uniref:Uncharacterized protein n=1 Tax=Xylaria curta TaxID=42375 RepID=A0ACC1N180_9PEZI|nr:hypothetical protein NUW58_g9098 [Xylaria curta]